MDNVNFFFNDFSESSDPLWFNSWLLWHRSACFASALMYFCLPCLSVGTQQQAKIHKSWPINKCHFLHAETPWECKQKVFPRMPFKLRAVCQLSRGRLIASAAAATVVVWCYLPRAFAFLLNVWWFETKQNTAVRNRPFPSFALNLSGLLPQHTASNGRTVCLQGFLQEPFFTREAGFGKWCWQMEGLFTESNNSWLFVLSSQLTYFNRHEAI